MKKLGILIIAIVLASMVVGPVCAESRYITGVVRQEQQYDGWCSVAAAKMVQDFHHKTSYNQEQIAAYMGLAPGNFYGVNDAVFTNMLQNYLLLNLQGSKYLYRTLIQTQPYYIGPSWSYIKSEINAGRPIILVTRFYTPGGNDINGHCRVVIGYNDQIGTTSDTLRVIDPWPESKGGKTYPYDINYYSTESIRFWHIPTNSWQYNLAIFARP